MGVEGEGVLVIDGWVVSTDVIVYVLGGRRIGTISAISQKGKFRYEILRCHKWL